MNKPLLAIVAVASTSVRLLAQDAPQPAATFRSEINYVQIPVRVLDAHGDFVRGLVQSDFQIFEDGQAQTIAAFSAVDIPFREVDATVPNAPLSAVDAVASNEPIDVDGRVYVFVLDNQPMSPAIALRTRDVVRGFIRDHLKANDIAAVVFTGAGRASPEKTARTICSLTTRPTPAPTGSHAGTRSGSPAQMCGWSIGPVISRRQPRPTGLSRRSLAKAERSARRPRQTASTISCSSLQTTHCR